MPFVPSVLCRHLGIRAGKDCRLRLKTVRSARRGNHSIGDRCEIGCVLSFDRPEATITIGDRCFIGKSHFVAAERITIEDDVVISWGVTIVDHNSHALDWHERRDDVTNWLQGRKEWSNVAIAPVTVRRNAWIGFNATILKGVTIGHGAVVGACSVVTKDVPPGHIVAGNPAIKRGEVTV